VTPQCYNGSMTSASPEAPRRPRPALTALVAVLVVTALGLAGWSVTAGDGPGLRIDRRALVTEPPSTDPGTSATSTSTSTTTFARAGAAGEAARLRSADLPVPEGAPVDPHAATAQVVHGTLSLPTIDVAQPLQEGVTLTAIDRGPSHWPGTAMPGEVGNVVVAGHRVTHTRPFHDIDQLQPGDPLVFTMNDGTEWTYALTGIEIVPPDAMHIVDQHPGHTATLFACHPKGSAAQRIVAYFRLVT
jgi:sortase A